MGISYSTYIAAGCGHRTALLMCIKINKNIGGDKRGDT